MIELDWDRLASLCATAITKAGGDEATAAALTDAVVAAERRGNSPVGVAHLMDYLDSLRCGRINGTPRPVVRNDRRSVITAAADDGIAQVAYHAARPALLHAVRECGVAVLSISESYTVGELGYYAFDLAAEGLVALAAANSTPLMSVYGAPDAIAGTNPLSFALPGDPPRLVDQASSAVAWVRLRNAAAAGESIPPDWAFDADGNPTTDAKAALLGAVLPFGGIKGSNLASIIELLAVLSGASFSIDAPDFASGDTPPRVGMFLVALDPDAFSADYLDRVDSHFERLRDRYGIDFGRYYSSVERPRLPDDLFARLEKAGQPTPAS
ncbi:MAG: Ldh family oxidoreductase [Pseudonocardia sp.]|nr:Ldh family oxidoreductase [Pseudonocardia sp.]